MVRCQIWMQELCSAVCQPTWGVVCNQAWCCGCKCHFPEVRLEMEGHFGTSWHSLQMLLCSPVCWHWLEYPLLKSRGDTSWEFKDIPVLAFQLPSLSPDFFKGSLWFYDPFGRISTADGVYQVEDGSDQSKAWESKRGKVKLLCLFSQMVLTCLWIDVGGREGLWPSLGHPRVHPVAQSRAGWSRGLLLLAVATGWQRGGSLTPGCAALESPLSYFHCTPGFEGSQGLCQHHGRPGSLLGWQVGACCWQCTAWAFSHAIPMQAILLENRKLDLQLLMQWRHPQPW